MAEINTSSTQVAGSNNAEQLRQLQNEEVQRQQQSAEVESAENSEQQSQVENTQVATSGELPAQAIEDPAEVERTLAEATQQISQNASLAQEVQANQSAQEILRL
ncbi:hypothetical protein [Catenovulum sediminis]|uniref:Uncharacterized protein n=1 Tax=Catenovulum sediminis TaxID=1740262 RepID=A0ABV1RCD6_9ALTE|nr:hypothetical protein [Catenovulum sediminis]